MLAGSGALVRLALFVAVSACIHALMLAVPVTAMRSQGLPGAGAAAMTLQLRLATLPAKATPKAETAPTPENKTVVPDKVPDASPARIETDPRPDPAPVPESAPDSAAASGGTPAPAETTAAIPIPQIADTQYLPSRLLDVYPKPMAEVPMVYPDAAASLDMSGRVTLLLLIDELGSVVEASVVEANPAGYFEQAAVDTFRGVLFAPGMRDGRPVKSRLVVEVSFEARTESARGAR